MMSIDNDSVYDLIELIEYAVEIPPAQAEDAGERIGEEALADSVRVVDELNENANETNFDYLNK